MGTVEYAKLVALIALLNVLNVPSTVISTTMARYVAACVHRNDMGTWRWLVRRGLSRILGRWVADGDWTLGDASRAIDLLAQENARRVYTRFATG